MSDKTKASLEKITMIIGVTIGVLGAAQSFLLIPYRMNQAEASIKILQDNSKADREILIRIEERVKQVQERMK